MANLIADPKNLNIFFRSKSFENECTLEDKWFGTKFSKEGFSEHLLTLMKSPNVKITKKVLDLPPVNTLLPKNLDILPEDPENTHKPMLLKHWDHCDLWYLKDDKFKLPKGFVKMKIYTNDCMLGRTVHSQVFLELWNKVIGEYLREYKYMASMASLESRSNILFDNLEIWWKGFNDSLPLFV